MSVQNDALGLTGDVLQDTAGKAVVVVALDLQLMSAEGHTRFAPWTRSGGHRYHGL